MVEVELTGVVRKIVEKWLIEFYCEGASVFVETTLWLPERRLGRIDKNCVVGDFGDILKQIRVEIGNLS